MACLTQPRYTPPPVKAGFSPSGRSTSLASTISMRMLHALQSGIGWRPQWAAALAIVLTASQAGCVERRMIVRTNPRGAPLYVDDYEIGTTPLATSFIYYGTRKIRLVKDGYETLVVNQPLPSPWYEYFPADFVAENLVPGHIRDLRILTYDCGRRSPSRWINFAHGPTHSAARSKPSTIRRDRAEAATRATGAANRSQPAGSQGILPSPIYNPQPMPPNCPRCPSRRITHAATTPCRPAHRPITPPNASVYTVPPPGTHDYAIPRTTPVFAPPSR